LYWLATSIMALIGRADRTMMHTAEVLRVFAEHRGDAIVISGRGGRHWMQISDTSMDLPLGDPAMGGHSGFGLGVALAQPDKRVVLFDSEGDILMSLGQLPTIAEQAPANFYHFILDIVQRFSLGGAARWLLWWGSAAGSALVREKRVGLSRTPCRLGYGRWMAPLPLPMHRRSIRVGGLTARAKQPGLLAIIADRV
jgi:thiamine pyrophosphate-dependent enzyme